MSKTTSRRIRRAAVGIAAVGAMAALMSAVALADPIGSQARVSAQGPGTGVGDADFDASEPAIAYNGQRNQYLQVWEGDVGGATDQEIFGRIIGADGGPIGGILRISNMGPGEPNFDAGQPKVTYNPTADEYLVVWTGEEDLGPPANNEDEIWGRRISGDGAFAGAQFRISEMGDDGDGDSRAIQPDVVYDPDLDQYVVVWNGRQPDPGVNQVEIFARRLAPDGSSVDTDDVRISDIGEEGEEPDASQPEIAYDSDAKQYLVVFYGDEKALFDDEIYGQRLAGDLSEIGVNDFQISNTGRPDGDAESPEVAYSSVAKRFLVVWEADNLASSDTEIFGEFLDANGNRLGADDFQISVSQPLGDTALDAFDPAVAASDRANEFLVAWHGPDTTAGLGLGEIEILAQRYDGNGTPIGTPRVRVSQMGPSGDLAYRGQRAATAYNSVANEYLVGWQGDDNTGGLVDDELEVYARRHGATIATVAAAANCKPVPARGTPNEVQVPSVITTGYLKTNQRTGAATVRRANALDAWLNAGILDKDLCGGSVVPEDLDANLTATSGPLGSAPTQADPRAVSIAPASNSNATFTANAIQMCINQRIYQAAIARANALRQRLDGKLTGGDLSDGTLTQSRLRQDLTITAATNNPSPPAASTTSVRQPQRAGCDTVKFTTQQAAINRRIAIQSVVRINEVLDEVNGGLDDANFMDGSITRVDFAPGVTP